MWDFLELLSPNGIESISEGTLDNLSLEGLEKVHDRSNDKWFAIKLDIRGGVRNWKELGLINKHFMSVDDRIRIAEELMKTSDDFKDTGKWVNWITKHHNIVVICVDTSKEWRINREDNVESVEYYGNIKVVDNRFNLCEW